MDPLTGWGEGEEKEEELEIQNWLIRTDRVVDNTLDGVESGRMMKVSRWRQQRLSFTDQSITFKSILPSESDVQADLDQVIQIIPVIIITEPPPEQTEIMKITEPHRSTSATQIEASTLVQYLETEKMNITEPQPSISTSIIKEPTKQSTTAPSNIYVNKKRVKLSVKEGRELARKNKSLSGWLLKKKSNHLQLSSVREEDEAMEVDEMTMLEVVLGAEHARRQRLAKCKARQTKHQTKAICTSLVEELCTGVASKAGRPGWGRY